MRINDATYSDYATHNFEEEEKQAEEKGRAVLAKSRQVSSKTFYINRRLVY